MNPSIPIELLRHATFLKLGDIFISPREIYEILAKSAEPLFRHDGDWKMGLLGSCTTLRFGGRHIALCTAHQIKQTEPDQICIINIEKSHFATANQLIAPKGSTYESDLFDLRIMDFTDNTANGAISSSFSFNLKHETAVRKGDEIIALITIGYPYKNQELIFEDAPESEGFYRVTEVHNKIVCKTATYYGPTSDGFLTRLKFIEPSDASADGLSGGPSFAITKDKHGTYAVKFAGVITRANGTYCHIINGNTIMNVLENAFKQHRCGTMAPPLAFGA